MDWTPGRSRFVGNVGCIRSLLLVWWVAFKFCCNSQYSEMSEDSTTDSVVFLSLYNYTVVVVFVGFVLLKGTDMFRTLHNIIE